MTQKTLLLILDGWGIAPEGKGNAPFLANTPNLDRIQQEYPRTTLACSGLDVGLPPGFMGNSEVGHMNIGAGRVVYQDMTRIDLAIEKKEFAANPVLLETISKVKAAGGRLHLMGLLSDGGVHSHINHLEALLDLAVEQQVEVVVHAFMDGRDTAPDSGQHYMARLVKAMEDKGVGRVASVAGRYWAMDRDRRWDRTGKAYAALTTGEGERAEDPVSAVTESYAKGKTDEFILPTVIGDEAAIKDNLIRDNDGIFFFNFRADRAKQLCKAFFDKDFNEFERTVWPSLAAFATMTRYDGTFPMDTAFPPQSVDNGLGQVLESMGAHQLRIAETEKYAHVTYFFNGGREEPFKNENRILVNSPRDVATYDLKPQMSCPEVTDRLVEAIGNDSFDVAVCNLANLDMVGHTGVIPAAIKASETVDNAVGRIAEAMLAKDGQIFLTADHGNAEEMIDAQGNPMTSHSMNLVPFVHIHKAHAGEEMEGGRLSDIAPTILHSLGWQKPEVMTGKSLIVKEGQ